MNNTVSTRASTGPHTIRRFFEDRGWRFYCALAAGVTLVGAGAYYFTQPKKKDSSSNQLESDNITTSPIDYAALSDESIDKLTSQERLKGAQVLKEKGNKLFVAKKYTEAIAAYTEAIRFKADPIYYSNRAACYSFLGHYSSVIADTNEALALDPMYIKAINRRAIAYEKEQRWDKALYDFTAVCILDEFKDDNVSKSMERVLKQAATVRAQERMKIKALAPPSTAYVNAYLDSFRPVNLNLPTTTDEASGDHYFALAYRSTLDKDYATAWKASEKAVALGCSPAYLPGAFNLKGTFAFLNRNTKAALDCLSKAIELDPSYVQCYLKRASIYVEQENIVAAFKEIDDAIAINAADPDIYYHRGQIYYITNNLEAAAKDYRESIRLDDSFVYAHVQLGVVQYKLGSLATSRATFEKILSRFPDSADVHNYYGELLADKKKLDDALDLFTKASKLDPKAPLPYINKAALSSKDEAIRLCKKAVEVDPTCDAAVHSLGQLYIEKGEPLEALKWYDLAIDLASTESELVQAISYREATWAQIKFAQDFASSDIPSSHHP